MQGGDLDTAVDYYRTAVQAAPDNPNYKIALERAMLAASRAHVEKARTFEQQDQLEAALGEYKRASELDPSNRSAAAKVATLDRTIRDRIEASRPKPAIEQMRERARKESAEPILNPASREPLTIRFNNASLRDILNFISNATGINVMYDREFQDRPTTVAARRRDAWKQALERTAGDEPVFLQGPQPEDDPGLPGHAAQARAVRRAGHPHLLHLARAT